MNWLKTPDLILSLSKDEAKISCFFSNLLEIRGCGKHLNTGEPRSLEQIVLSLF